MNPRRIPIPGISVPVSPLALGTAGCGSEIRPADAFALFDAYAEAGGTVFDTAHVYADWLPQGRGKSEETIGQWLRQRGSRAGVVISTKGGHHDLASGRRRLNPRELEQDLNDSLDRLRIDHVDLYWFHCDDPAVPVVELLEWAKPKIGQGRIRALGCSNWSVTRQRQAAAAADADPSLPRFCASQIMWSLADCRELPAAGGHLVPMTAPMHAYHAAAQLPVFAYSSQGNGFFGTTKRNNPGLERQYGTARNHARQRLADHFARRHGATPNQVALAWLWHQPIPTVAIVGSRTLEQLRDSIAAQSLALSPEEVAALSDPPGDDTPSSAPLSA